MERLFFAHYGDVDLAALDAVELAKVNVLGVAAQRHTVNDGEYGVVAADHGFQVTGSVASDGTVRGQKVVVVVGSEGGDQLFQFVLDVNLEASKALID